MRARRRYDPVIDGYCRLLDLLIAAALLLMVVALRHLAPAGQGSWEQTLINWDVAAPVSGLDGLFYGVGVVFASRSGLNRSPIAGGALSSAELVKDPRSRRSSRRCTRTRRRDRGRAAGPRAVKEEADMTLIVFVARSLGAMALGMPIAYALLVCGVALMYYLDMFDAQIVAQNVINGADSFPLMAVPFFMLAGEIMNTGGLSKRIVNVALAGRRPRQGRPGLRRHHAACILSALSGSAVADAAALSALLVPMMVKAGHDKARARAA